MQADLRLEALIDAMHAALLAADYSALGQLSPELDTVLANLPKGINEKALERLRRKADRNAVSAAAAAKGVRSAIRRLNDVRQNAIGLVTYDENGQRAEPSGQRELSRRL